MKLSIAIALIVIALIATPALGGDQTQIKQVVYENAIDDEIAQSRQMASLMTSRSSNLRKKGHREASMAMYLETHRDELVIDMMNLKLEPKDYKIERFLNDRFRCTCYATWASSKQQMEKDTVANVGNAPDFQIMENLDGVGIEVIKPTERKEDEASSDRSEVYRLWNCNGVTIGGRLHRD